MRSHVPGRIAVVGALFLGLAACSAEPQPAPAAEAAPAESATERLIARARSLELDTPYTPPPGDALEHHTSGFAKIMCSAVFITGLDPEFAAENVGYFTSPYAERAKVGTPVVDREAREVRITLPNGVTRVARHMGIRVA